MREVGTDNSIYFDFKKGFTGPPWVEVLMYTPESTFKSLIAIFLFYPIKNNPEVKIEGI